MTEKFILDATAGFRMMWFDKHHPNALYLDQRPECEPDQVADWTNPLPYPDNNFRLIVFDPPHFIRHSEDKLLSIRKYGFLQPETWQSDLKKGFNELWRVLAPMGILLLKWSNIDASSDQVLALLPIKPLIYQITAKEPIKMKNGKVSNRNSDQTRTLWFCFMKLPEVALNHSKQTEKVKPNEI
jgi:hypothetical protein